jgi:IclR helix-turn-helix domain
MTDIAAAIRKRIKEIEAELASHPLQREKATLERALADLDTKPANGKSAKAPRRRNASGRAPRGERRKQVLKRLEDQPGSRPSEIARAIGTSPNQVHGIIAKLRREKLVKKQGRGYAVSKAAAGSNGAAASASAKRAKG